MYIVGMLKATNTHTQQIRSVGAGVQQREGSMLHVGPKGISRGA